MDSEVKQNIYLYSGYTPRSTALLERVEKACGKHAIVVLIEDTAHILEKRTQNSQSVVILDLPNIKKSAIQTIQSVIKQSPDVKILAIHIYTTHLLVEPLVQAGIHGYLMYEPTIEEVQDAIASIFQDEVYLPPQIK